VFSYRHGFHAGNHADVLKHIVLVQCLAHLGAKEKPFWVIDTHAGAGSYALDSGYTAQSAESESGIGRLWNGTDLPPAIMAYLEQVHLLNPDGQLRHYPGSPQIAVQMMRHDDRLRLFEMHPTEGQVLQDYFREAGRRVSVRHADGFAGLKAILPPPPRRALVLIDPSYEDKNDYAAVVTAMAESLQRFATGTYAVWYPQVQRAESRQLPAQLQGLATGDWLHVSLRVMAPRLDGFGLHGSGMFVFNPPWTLAATLGEAMPVLVDLLAQDEHAGFELKFRQS